MQSLVAALIITLACTNALLPDHILPETELQQRDFFGQLSEPLARIMENWPTCNTLPGGGTEAAKQVRIVF